METHEKLAGWTVVACALIAALILLPALGLAAPFIWAALAIMDRLG
jgi:hypothetical protein